MHELSIAQSIITTIEKLKEKERFDVLRKVYISVGRLSGIDIEALCFALQTFKKEPLVKETIFEISSVELKIKCNRCGVETQIVDYQFICSSCGGNDYEITSGDTIEISGIEVD